MGKMPILDPTTARAAMGRTSSRRRIDLQASSQGRITPAVIPSNNPFRETAISVLASIPKITRFSMNYVRGFLAGIVMQDQALIPKFKELSERAVEIEKLDVPFGNKYRVIQAQVKLSFPKESRGALASKFLRFGLWIADNAGWAFYLGYKIGMKEAAKRFIAGENLDQAAQTIQTVHRKTGVGYIYDVVAEEADSPAAAQANVEGYLTVLRRPIIGPEKVVSVKLTGLVAGFDETKIDEAVEVLKTLAFAASQNDAVIVIDMERYHIKDATLTVLERFMEETQYKYGNNVGIVIQTYLQDSLEDIDRLSKLAAKVYHINDGNSRLFVRFVKGAYQSKDKDQVLPNHEAVNQRYIDCLEVALREKEYYRIAVASHNLRTISESITLANKYSTGEQQDDSNIEFEMLLGMPAAPILLGLAAQGYNTRFYMPVGSFGDSLAYFMRRMEENANSSSCQMLYAEYSKGNLSQKTFLDLAFTPVRSNGVTV
ncbi:MAG: proline dehydrogenase family protein [Candidatus Margulisiibacteriota bacterium]